MVYLGIGAEAGWLYRITNDGPIGLDFGAGIELFMSNWGLWAAFKLQLGYLLP